MRGEDEGEGDGRRLRDGMSIIAYSHHPRNHNRQINNKDYLEGKLFPRITSKLKRKISPAEATYLVRRVKKFSPDQFRGYTMDVITETLTDVLVDELLKFRCEVGPEPIDTHEIFKRELGVAAELPSETRVGSGSLSGFTPKPFAGKDGKKAEVSKILDMDTNYKLQQTFNHVALRKQTRLLLDSKYRLLEGDGTRFFKWSYVNSTSRSQGSVNDIGVVRDVTQLRVGPIRIPYTPSAVNDFKRVTMLIRELQPQSCVAHEDRFYHFMFETEIDGQWINLKPYEFDEGKIKFAKPITQLDTFTITFASPLAPITFDRDRLDITIIYSNPARIVYSEPHNILTGERVSIFGFNTLRPIEDVKIINEMNLLGGNIATVISPTELTIPVDLTSLQDVLPGSVTLTNGSTAVTGVGTSFTTDPIAPGTYIFMRRGSGFVFLDTITSITDDFNLDIGFLFNGPTESGLSVLYSFGEVKTINNSPIIEGGTTTFSTSISPGDHVMIVDLSIVGSPDIKQRRVLSVESDTFLTLSEPYDGTTSEGFAKYIFKDNTLRTSFTSFLESKRIFIDMLVEYILPG